MDVISPELVALIQTFGIWGFVIVATVFLILRLVGNNSDLNRSLIMNLSHLQKRGELLEESVNKLRQDLDAERQSKRLLEAQIEHLKSEVGTLKAQLTSALKEKAQLSDVIRLAASHIKLSAQAVITMHKQINVLRKGMNLQPLEAPYSFVRQTREVLTKLEDVMKE